MHQKLKSKLWRLRRVACETLWKLMGGQRRRVFAEQFDFTPQTVFPSHRTMQLPAGDARSVLVRYTDFVQMHSICRYLELCSHAPTIVEVGAFQGVYAVILGRLAQRGGGRVIAVEPDGEAFAQLVENVKRNGLEETVVCEQIAVLDRTGSAKFESQASQSKVVVGDCSGGMHCDTLAGVLKRHKIERVDVLLIDVEGAELPVLRGFPWGQIEVERIYCEMHPYAWRDFGYDPREIQAFLGERNLRCFDMFLMEHSLITDQRHIGPTLLIPSGPAVDGMEERAVSSRHAGMIQN